MKLSKKIASCLLLGTLVCQPIALNGSNNSVIVAEAHSQHHADIHHNNSNAGSYDTYYYCDGHSAHLHDGGVCPYASSAVISSDNTSVSSSNQAAQSSLVSQSTVTPVTGKSIELSTGSSIDLSEDLLMIVQDVLKQKGYDCGTVDGIAGTKTKEAIRKYLDENEGRDTDSLIISMIAESLGI